MTDQTYDRFTLPGDIPDAAFWTDSTRNPREARARADAALGRADPGGGYSASHPAGRGWIPQSRDLGLPAEPRTLVIEHAFSDGPLEDAVAALGAGQVFTPALQVRFLDQLAWSGNVRAAAGKVGVSHETVYRLRRRDARFAALWNTARGHARTRAEATLGDRALDGVLEEVWYRGELVGHRRRYDARLLLAHVARLDRLVGDEDLADDTAAAFDANLARLAGHPEPAGFAEAAGLWDQRPGGEVAAERPPTREEYLAWRRGQAIAGCKRQDEGRLWDEAGALAEAEYDAWEAGVTAAVEHALGKGGATEPCAAAAASAACNASSPTPSRSSPPLPSSSPPSSSSSPRTRGPSAPDYGNAEPDWAPACAGVTNEDTGVTSESDGRANEGDGRANVPENSPSTALSAEANPAETRPTRRLRRLALDPVTSVNALAWATSAAARGYPASVPSPARVSGSSVGRA